MLSYQYRNSCYEDNLIFIMGIPIAGNMVFNSLSTGKFEWNFGYVIFNQILVIDGWGISCKIALIWMSLDFTDDQSGLVQVMAWCHQATSHYLSQCWPRSTGKSLYGVSRPQWVKKSYRNSHHKYLIVSHDLLIFIMGIPILENMAYIKMPLWFSDQKQHRAYFLSAVE